MRTNDHQIYPRLLQKVVLPLGERLSGQRVSSRLEHLREAQWWSRETLIQARDERLRQLVEVAYREVPMYRQLFDQAGVKPEEIERAGDLRRLPVVTKATIRAAGFSNVTRRTPWRIHSACSSGSTGEPVTVWEDSETAGYRIAAFLLSLEWAGWRMGEAHAQFGARFPRSWAGWLKDRALRCFYFSAVDLSDSSLDRVLDSIDRHRIEHVWGFPCALRFLAERAAAAGWNRELRSVVTWGDTLGAHRRRTIESAFKTRVLDTYGCGEGMQVAAQCERGPFYHVNMLDTILELVDEEGRPVPPGVPGRVLLTRLHPGAMPFIRYKVGDFATSAGDRMCSCRRQHELIEGIQGRESDAVTTPSGRKLVVYVFTNVFELVPGIVSWQAVQKGRRVEFRIVSSNRGTSLANELRSKLADAGMDDMDVAIDFVDRIPLTSGGKHRFILHE